MRLLNINLMDVRNVLLAILGLAFLMIIHEGGHFLAARAFGLRVSHFAIGFGPTFFKIIPKDGYFWFTTALNKIQIRLWRHDPVKHGPTIFQVGMIPFFAFVRIDGMNPLEEVDPKDKGSYANASLPGRIVTIFGGPLANYLFASVLFFLAFFFGGRLDLSTTDINVIDGNPAIAAGAKSGDRVTEVAGVPVSSWEQMAQVISKHPGKPISLVVEREGQKVALSVTPRDDNGKGKIGVKARGTRIAVSAKEASVLAVTSPALVVKSLVIGLSEVIAGKAETELGGPVRIVKDAASVVETGMAEFVIFLASLSAYLGAFNLFPFPALDGGRLVFLGYEAVTRRRPNAHIEAVVHLVGFAMIFGLMIYVTLFKDLGFGMTPK